MLKVIAIVGPTAVGKTRLSIELAKKLNGEIISGDSMQIYKGMDIGTAKISEEEKEGIIHHLLDELNPDESYSVAEFQKSVRLKIAEISKKGKLPIIVGGTGLYIKSVLYDYEFSDVEAKSDKNQYEGLTNEEVHEILMGIDPVSAKALHPNNRRRVVRAINIFNETNTTKSETLDAQEKKLLFDCLVIGLTDDREVLYERINSRVDKMINDGLVQEVKSLMDNGVFRDAQSISAIGYKEIYDYLLGLTDFETATELLKRNSRRLAKRQYTWFRNQMDTVWFNVDINDFDKTIDGVIDFINTNTQ